MTTQSESTYQVQAEASADGAIWQALDVPETVEITGDLTDWFAGIAAEVAEESGAVPGSYVRVLAWPADETDLTPDTVVFTDEHQVIDSDREVTLEQVRRMLGLRTTNATGDTLRRWEKRAKEAGRSLVPPVGRQLGRGGMQKYRLGDVLRAIEVYDHALVEMPEPTSGNAA